MTKILFAVSILALATAEPSRQTRQISTNTNRTLNKAVEAITKLKSELKKVKNQINSGVHTIHPRNCLAAKQQGGDTSGVYTIQPDYNDPFDAWCDMETDGGGWTVFQRRQDGSVNFQRNLIEYTRGFGNVSGEHWLGLEKIYRLTKYVDFEPELWIDLEDFDGNSRYEHYNRFYITAPPGYYLYVYDPSGTAGDSLTYHRGYRFSTPDRDVDGNSGKNCALTNEGAWWFVNCQHSNLNGKYYYGNSPGGEKGVVWNGFRGSSYSHKQSEMKTRPSRLGWLQTNA
jgi:hypothetical protein